MFQLIFDQSILPKTYYTRITEQVSGKRAILFDMDGVLVKTEPLKAQAHAATIQRFGGKVSRRIYREVMGQSHVRVSEAFLRAAGMDIDLREYDRVYDEIYGALLQTKLKPTPGVRKFIEAAQERGFQMTIISSSPRETMKRILEGTGLKRFFEVYVSADDVDNPKPSPDAYLLGLHLLNVPAEASIAIEDTPAGITAALRANLRVLAFRHPLNTQHSFSDASGIIGSFLDHESIFRWINYGNNKSGR